MTLIGRAASDRAITALSQANPGKKFWLLSCPSGFNMFRMAALNDAGTTYMAQGEKLVAIVIDGDMETL